MPPPTTVPEFAALLARTGLVPEADVPSLQREWRAATSGTDADVDRFRRFLVRNKHLTDYQAALIARGHADGFRVGGYTILDRIGKGQTAGVYKAAHPSGQVVALKVLPGSKAKDPNVLGRFEREGRLLTQLDHPNVVRAYQVGAANGVHFIAMEHLDGETLDELLARRGKVPPAEACRLVSQALAGVGHLHARKVVHRDLKPANLMVTWPGPADPPPADTLAATLKVLDVGIGRAVFDEGSDATRDLELTSEGAILGTPDYLAPEQARDARTADARSDLYSLGCVLYHLIAGAPPFTEPTVVGQMVKHTTEPVPRLPAGCPPGLQAVLDGLTAKDPAGRYQTATEAVAALAPFLPGDAASAAATRLVPAFREWLDSEAGTAPIPPEVRSAAAAKAGSGVVRPVAPAKAASGTHPAPAVKPAASSAAVKPAPKPPAPPVPPPAEPAEIDVELYVPPPPSPSVVRAEPEERSAFDLDRRDLVMLAVGGAGVLAAVVFGVTLASALKPADVKPADTKPADGDGK